MVAPNAIPNGAIPVVFLDGYQLGCTGGSSFSSNFASADAVVQASNLVSVYFDNCTVPGSTSANNPTIETLGAAFGQFLGTLQYVNGTPVPLVDVVAHSMGGLIVRAYLSGMQNAVANKPVVFTPPVNPGIRKAIFIATPHFGTAVTIILGNDQQTKEMSVGSQFLYTLNTWNQGTDDLRGVDALAIAGNGGTGAESLLTGSPGPGFDDGAVQLTSASIGFARPRRTRVVPDCHTQDALVVSNGVCSASATAINHISDASNVVGQIITSFLTGTTAWSTLGTAIESTSLGAVMGGVLVAAQDLNGVQQALTAGVVGTSTLGVNAVAYKEAVAAGSNIAVQVTAPGAVTLTSKVNVAAGTSTPVILKPGPSISGIVPAGIAQFPLNVAPGSYVTVYGANLAASVMTGTAPYPTQLGDVQVLVNGTAAPLLYAAPGQINILFPNIAPGLVTVTVKNSTGQQSVNVMNAAAVPSIFTFTGVASGPAAAENAATGAIVGANAPHHAGDYVAIYMTGLGQSANTSTVTVGGQSCGGQYFFAGVAPGYVALDQVNCQIPAGVTGASVPVIVTASGRASNTATLTIQ